MTETEAGEKFDMNQAPRKKTVSMRLFPIAPPDPSIPVVLDPESPDRILAAMSFLSHIGYPRRDIVTAATGYSNLEEPQVLVLGHSYISVVGPEGDKRLEVGIKEIRGLRVRGGVGVELWVTPNSAEEALRESPIFHCLPDIDAAYLEKTWLLSSPNMHDGVQLNVKPWREEQYAHYVGRVIMEAARCETAISTLLLQLERQGAEIHRNSIRASGEQLVNALKKVGHESPAIQDVVERYEEWSNSRNFAVHGFRGTDENGKPTSIVHKMRRKYSGNGDVFESMDQDYKDLALLWQAYYALVHDVQEISLRLQGSGDLAEKLRTIPIPTTVVASERLPADG